MQKLTILYKEILIPNISVEWLDILHIIYTTNVTSLPIFQVWKTLETAESTLLDMLTAKDYDCRAYFGDNAVPTHKPPETVSLKLRADRHETEEFYLTVSILS